MDYEIFSAIRDHSAMAFPAFAGDGILVQCMGCGQMIASLAKPVSRSELVQLGLEHAIAYA